MTTRFVIYNRAKGIAFRLTAGRRILAESAKTYLFVCDAEKGIAAAQKAARDPTKVKAVENPRGYIVVQLFSTNGRLLACSAPTPLIELAYCPER